MLIETILGDIKFKKRERQGAPQLTDDGVLAYVEFVSEEQRSISMLIELNRGYQPL